MSRIYMLSDANATRRRFPVFLVDATDGLTPETGEGGGQPQITKIGGAWANTSATLTSVGNGHYYVELTTIEINTLGYFAIRYKSAATAEFNMDGQVINFDLFTAVAQTGDSFARLGAPAGASVSADIAAIEAQTDDIGLAGSGLTAIPDNNGIVLLGRIPGIVQPQTGDSFARLGAPAGASVSADILTIDNLVDDLESRLGTPSNLGTGATVAANLVDIEAQTDDIGVAGAGLTTIPWNVAWDAEVQSEVADALDVVIPSNPTTDSINERIKAIDTKLPTGNISDLTTAQVNTEVLDVLTVDTFVEPGQEAPPATTTLAKKIGYIYKFLRNKVTQSGTEMKVYADDGVTVDQKSTVSNTAGVTTREEFVTGP